MAREFNAVYVKVPEGYIGYVEELPGANTQGSSIEETRANLDEAIVLILETNRDLLEETIQGEEAIRETITVNAP